MNKRQMLAAAVAVLALGRCAFHVYEATYQPTYEIELTEVPELPAYQYDPAYQRLDPEQRAMVDHFNEVMQQVEAGGFDDEEPADVDASLDPAWLEDQP